MSWDLCLVRSSPKYCFGLLGGLGEKASAGGVLSIWKNGPMCEQRNSLCNMYLLKQQRVPLGMGATGQGQRGQGCKQYFCPPLLRPYLPGSHIYPTLLYRSCTRISNVFESWVNQCYLRKPELNTALAVLMACAPEKACKAAGLPIWTSFVLCRFLSFFSVVRVGFRFVSFCVVLCRFCVLFSHPFDQWEF